MSWQEEFMENMLGKYIDVERIDYYFKLKYSHIPKQLFKYRAFDEKGNSLKNLQDSTIWMNSPQNFNDPYDCAFTVKLYKLSSPEPKEISDLLEILQYTKSEAAEISNAALQMDDPFVAILEHLVNDNRLGRALATELTDILKSRHDQMSYDFSEKSKNLTKLCSFCESANSILMWAHYAQNHTGFCIEYDFTTLGPDDINTKFLYPVQYSELLHDHSGLMEDLDFSKANPLSIVLPAITKAKEWSYEKEWRLVHSNGLLPAPQSIRIPQATRVYAGVKIAPANLEKLENICNSLSIPLVRMKMSSTAFSIVPQLPADQ